MLYFYLDVPCSGPHYIIFHFILWRDRGCAVGVHDRQGSGIGKHIIVGSRNGRPVGMKADLNA
jgi:hypothetical protein